MPSVNELSQMFPKLDGDLRCVTTHFRFDHLVAADGSCVDNPDANELKTPLQNPKQFIGQATIDDDDDEATLSNDNLAMQQTSDGIISTATKLLEDVIKNSAPKKQHSEPLADTTNFKRFHTTNPLAHVQKQSSLHSTECASSATQCDTAQPQTQRRHNYEYSRFISVDQRSISDTEDNVANEFGSIERKGKSKTQSCQALSTPRSPGAILVKEKFIEFPKHVAHRTSSLGYVENTENAAKPMPASSESMSKLPTRKNSSRFTTTKVDESQLGASVLKEI